MHRSTLSSVYTPIMTFVPGCGSSFLPSPGFRLVWSNHERAAGSRTTHLNTHWSHSHSCRHRLSMGQKSMQCYKPWHHQIIHMGIMAMLGTCRGLSKDFSCRTFRQEALTLMSSSCDVSYSTIKGTSSRSRISASRILPFAMDSNFFSTAGSTAKASRPDTQFSDMHQNCMQTWIV